MEEEKVSESWYFSRLNWKEKNESLKKRLGANKNIFFTNV